MTLLDLPAPMVARTGNLADVPIITRMTRQAETIDAGEPLVTLEDVESDWRRPGFDPSEDAILIFDGDRLAAYAEVPGWRAEAAVHPDYRGVGIGTALLGWIEKRALDRTPAGREARVGQTIPAGHTAAADLFIRHGYERRHTSWILRLPAGRAIDQFPLPAGTVIRPYRPGAEDFAVFRVIEDAFSEWPDREPSTFEQWQTEVMGRADFDPTLLLVAVHKHEVIGAAFGISYPDEGWVEQLAVREDHRGRGIAKALLREAFDEFRRRGSPAVGLSTDSRTGALNLYLQVGMVVTASWVHYSKLLLNVDNPVQA
ncbi:MAG: GNAT family N-acetyltransferase [Acidimicrobiia bacterium]